MNRGFDSLDPETRQMLRWYEKNCGNKPRRDSASEGDNHHLRDYITENPHTKRRNPSQEGQ